jgi:WD40 repeat protein
MQILTSLSKNSTPQLWDSKGNRLVSLEYDWDTYISDAKFSPDGRHIWTGGDGARLWDRQGNFLAVLGDDDVRAHEGEFSPDSMQILTVSGDDTAQLWDIKGNLLAVLPLHQESSSIPTARWSPHAVFSPDGRQILTASSKTARLWDVSEAIAAHSEQMTALQTFQEGVAQNNAQPAVLGDDNISAFTAKFSPDGQQILALSNDGTNRTARLWDSKGNLLAVLREHEEEVSSAEFSPDGRHILTDSINTARLWDSKGNLLAVLRAHEDSLRGEAVLYHFHKIVLHLVCIVFVSPYPNIRKKNVSRGFGLKFGKHQKS